MDKSKLPNMQPGKVVPTPTVMRPKPKKKSNPKGGLAGALDAIKKRKKKMDQLKDL
jgi:hypothetical protein